ncbi:MAG: hypothetical protein JSS74_03520 [Actinobacteria bacterium]|nr:hypothetical protein [Actinomycetota bacterium]
MPRKSASADPRRSVLELRIHGVRNTTPEDLLDLPRDQVEQVAGDNLGAFWRPTAAALALPAKARGHVPGRITREAYSWGGMVRTTPGLGGSGAAGAVLGVLARIGYALLLPFALANAVQWVRRLKLPDPEQFAEDRAHTDTPSRATTGSAATQERSLLSERGHRFTAGATRLFGLLLTLIFTSTAVVIALGLGAAQCAARPALCAPLSAVFDPLAPLTPGQCFALLSLVPIAAVAALWALSAASRLRYNSRSPMVTHRGHHSGDDDDPAAGHRGVLFRRRTTATVPAAQPPLPLIGQPGLWSNPRTGFLARLHLAAGVLLSVGFVSLQASTSPWGEGWRIWHVVCTAVALIGLVAAGVLTFILPTTAVSLTAQDGSRWPNRASAIMLIAACVLAAIILLGAAFEPFEGESAPASLTLINEVVISLVFLAGVLAFTGLWWRHAATTASRPHTAWSGRAPAVFMMLALTVAIALSAILITTTGNVLNGSASAAQLVDPTGSADGAPATSLQVPSAFLTMGTTILLALLAGLVVIGARVLRRRDLTMRASAWGQKTWAPRPDLSGDARVVAERNGPFTELPPESDGVLPPDLPDLNTRILSKRATAARLQILEPALGLLCALFGVAIVLGILWTTVAQGAFGLRGLFDGKLWLTEALSDPGTAEKWIRNILHGTLDISLALLSLTGIGLTAALSTGAKAKAARPLGLVWDVVCFLPRTGQPFGPPCYAERAVPEIAARAFAWLNDRDEDPAQERIVILAAHSMGALPTVSALALLAGTERGPELLERVRLLTFGVQLRAYFGRMLPELLGSDVLGTQPCLAPRLGDRDPWAADAGNEAGTAPARSGTLSGGLLPAPGVPWRSLWRLTDYLGFPALGSPDKGMHQNAVDRYAQELDLTGYIIEVPTHSTYYRSRAYAQALDEIAT